MNILITMCARGGSKGIPGKNIKPLGGKPLISYSIDMAHSFSKVFKSVIGLSTDDEDIKAVAKECGLDTDYIRPSELATDTAGKIDTIKHLVFYEERKRGILFDYILDLDITSPLRTLEDLTEAFNVIKTDTCALSLFSVNAAARNPYFNMVEKQESGFYDLIKKSPDGSVMSRQKAPAVYDLNASFYFYRRDFFNKDLKSPITANSRIYQMNHICFDLDHPIDFEFLEFLLLNDKITFFK